MKFSEKIYSQFYSNISLFSPTVHFFLFGHQKQISGSGSGSKSGLSAKD
jgi:hypothetical protein